MQVAQTFMKNWFFIERLCHSLKSKVFFTGFHCIVCEMHWFFMHGIVLPMRFNVFLMIFITNMYTF